MSLPRKIAKGFLDVVSHGFYWKVRRPLKNLVQMIKNELRR